MLNLKKKQPTVSTTTKIIPLTTANPVGGEAVHAVAVEAAGVVAAAAVVVEAKEITTTATLARKAKVEGAMEAVAEAVVEINKVIKIIKEAAEAEAEAKAIEDDKNKTNLKTIKLIKITLLE